MLCAWLVGDQADSERVIEARRYLWRKWPILYKDALAKGAEVSITGDIYHTAQDMLSDGPGLGSRGTISKFSLCRN